MEGIHFAKSLLAMAGVTYLVRALPFLLLRKKIENRFVRSVLYYAPYAVLSAMTIPDILYSTGNALSALVGLAAALAMAFFEKPMVLVAIVGSGAAVLVEVAMRGGI